MKLKQSIILARIHQYVKNGFIFLPVFWGYKISDKSALINTFWAFVVFSLVASSIYAFNDVKDIKEDLAHPRKRFRPLAAGEISIKLAAVTAMTFC